MFRMLENAARSWRSCAAFAKGFDSDSKASSLGRNQSEIMELLTKTADI